MPPADPANPEVRLLRAIHGLCPDHDDCTPDMHEPEPEPEPGPWWQSQASRRTVLAALEDAADHRQDLIAHCGDCHDGSCPSCVFRAEAAAEYDRLAQIVAHAEYEAGS